jgi:hypothetical protein
MNNRSGSLLTISAKVNFTRNDMELGLRLLLYYPILSGIRQD